MLIPRKLQVFPNISEHNWLNHRLIISFLEECAVDYVSGVLADIGCGMKPYSTIFLGKVSVHVGLDLDMPRNTEYGPDIIASAYQMSIRSVSCDAILCTEVLEHLNRPLQAVTEMNRILKKGGFAIVTVPLFWHIHEAPRDYYRFTEYGLRFLFETAGFEVVELQPMSGFIVTFSQLFIYWIRLFQRGRLLRFFGALVGFFIQHIALKLNRYDKSTGFTNLYGLVGRKVTDL